MEQMGFLIMLVSIFAFYRLFMHLIRFFIYYTNQYNIYADEAAARANQKKGSLKSHFVAEV